MNKTIKYWNLNSLKCLDTVEGDDPVCKLNLIENNRLVSSNNQCRIRIWILETYELVIEYREHDRICRALEELFIDKSQAVLMMVSKIVFGKITKFKLNKNKKDLINICKEKN